MAKRETLDDRICKFARRIQPVYKLLDWKWYYGSGDRVPTVAEIVDVLRELASSVRGMRLRSSATGGLYVQVSGVKSGCPVYKMWLEVADYAEPAKGKCIKK